MSLVGQWMSPPARAGDTGSIPGLGRLHLSLSLHVTTTAAGEPRARVLQQEESRQ